MKLSLIVTHTCSACSRAETSLKNIILKHPEISLNIIDINDFNDNVISIVPALLVDNELFSYGDIDEAKLLSYISHRRGSIN